MDTLQKGFTLVELMIVIAIIGILTAVALPAFQDYTIRSKISEVILALSACRAPISEVYQSGAETPPGPNNWGCEIGASQATKYVAAISTDANGVVSATVQNVSGSVNGSVVTLTPLALPAPGAPAIFTGGNSQQLYGWTCGSTGNGTTVRAKYLPGSCRG